MQKRVTGLLITFTLIIILIGFVSSQTCDVKLRANCNVGGGEYIIMSLSSATNAHGEFPDLGTYPYVLCCNFGGGDTTCTTNPSNKIIGLSSATNAHAEDPLNTNYPVDVCNKNLECVGTGMGCDLVYPIEVLNLSAATNAHIGTGAGYNYAICCKYTSLFISPDCDLTSASWEFNNVVSGTQVDMILQGVGTTCTGAAIDFTIYEDDPITDDFVISINGNYDTETWIAQWMDGNEVLPGDQDPVYYFTAEAILSGDTISSLDSATNPKLTVTQQSAEHCSSIHLCSDYPNEAECESDKTLCNVARGNPNCDPEEGVCSCSWNSGAGTCEFSQINIEDDIFCENGYTLCTDSETGLLYCYPGDTCAEGDEPPPSDGDGDCEIGEGCLSEDCEDGDIDSCVAGATCLGGMCSDGTDPTNITGCGNGYTMCYDGDDTGLLYCYPSDTCPVGEGPPSNNDDICDSWEGCSSTDCDNSNPDADPNQYKDSCLLDAFCLDGVCYSPTASAAGKCTFAETTDDDCADGFLTYNWTVTWTGTAGTEPSRCQDGSRVVPCPAQIQLPFFNIYSIIIIIIVIFLIYYIVVRSRRKKLISKKKKKKR